MNMKLQHILISTTLIAVTLSTQGCFSWWGLKEDRQEIQSELARKGSELDRHTRAYVTGAVDALARVPDKGSEAKVAQELAENAQRIVGLPQPGDEIHVDDVIAATDGALENLEDREKDVVKLARRQEILGHDLKDTEEKLIELGELKQAEEKQGFFSSLWVWLTGTFGLIGAVAICIVAGPVILPILGQLFGWLVSKLPMLITWMGVTSKNLTQNIIRGVHDAKERIKNADEDKPFSKDEVLNILKIELGKNTNTSDKDAIDRIKRKFK
jgi:hypothetical protein